KSNTKMIIAVVVIAVLVLGGAGAAIFFLTKGDDKGNNAAPASGGDDRSATTKSTPPSEDKPKETSPADVQQAYIEAYESKKFSAVVESACKAYKDKFGTDTSELEKQLEPYDIKATADGEPD